MGLKVNVEYKRIKRIYLRVKNGEVYITAPFRTPNKEITNMVNNHIDRINELINKKTDFTIWGIKYDLECLNGDNRVVIEDKCYCFYKDDYNKVLDKYFSEEVKKEMIRIIDKYQEKMDIYNLHFNKLIIRKMTSRWGSCKPKDKKITLNSNLAKYDKIYLEYVFCHEIAHLRYANHAKEFHDFLELLFPNAKIVRKELKKHC